MTYRRQTYEKYTRTKNAEKQRKILGCCSIYKILDNCDMDTQEKIAYIRHNYTYYDGHTELFNDPNTREHNENHAVLNDIIRMVVYKQSDPGLLKEVNLCMV